MRIGFTLPINYLTGNISNKADVWWQEIYGSIDECLKTLKELGVTSIEINELCAETPPIQLKHAVKAIKDAGLEITVHGWLPEMEDESDIPLGVRELEKTLVEYKQQNTIPFTVHSHKSSISATKSQITRRTLHDLNLLATALAKNSVFILALELCRRKEYQSVGTTFAEVLFVAKQIGFENLGLCWDVGHSQANYRKKKDSRLPCDEFTKNVIHTHIHDIGLDGRTHGPVLARQGYVRDCVNILKSSGYTGVYNLELLPSRWGVSPKECRSQIEASIHSMSCMLTN